MDFALRAEGVIALFLTIIYLIILKYSKQMFINFLLFQLRYYKKNVYKGNFLL